MPVVQLAEGIRTKVLAFMNDNPEPEPGTANTEWWWETFMLILRGQK